MTEFEKSWIGLICADEVKESFPGVQPQRRFTLRRICSAGAEKEQSQRKYAAKTNIKI